MARFKPLIKRNEGVFIRAFGEAEAREIIREAKANYALVIDRLPWIGGRDNPLVGNLIGSAQLLSLIMALDARKLPVRDTGRIVHEVYQNTLSGMSPIALFFMRRFARSAFRLEAMRRASRRSLKKKYEGDWVFEYKACRRNGLLFENSYRECAICKFYAALGYERYLPYLCLLDYSTFTMLGLKLERAVSLGNGGDHCDFRVFRNGVNAPAWPPEGHAEFKERA